MLPSGLVSSKRLLGALLCSAALTLTGCGAGLPAGPTAIPMSAISGSAYGGGVPIYDGRVRLWVTNSQTTGSSYGTQPTEVTSAETVTTDAYGNFSINSGYTCTSGEYAYVTITGGYTGGGTQAGIAAGANPNSVQMAALGSCASVGSPTAGSGTGNNSTVRVYVSEASTVAAAYALSHFISEDPTNLGAGDQRVWVNSTPNNVGTGACTVTTGVTTSCTGAGLAHAFANAANLVHAVNFNSIVPNGAANTTLDGTNSSGNNSAAIVPQMLINTLANIDESCVNTAGGTATSGTVNDGSACGILFSNTTIGTNTPPSDTLMALVNLAKSPTGYSGSSVGNLYAQVPKNPGFSPYLASAPTSYALAIQYPGVTVSGTTTGFTSPISVALDANDTVYVLDKLASGSAVAMIQSNGTSSWRSSSSTYTAPVAIATDTYGHVFYTNSDTAGTTALQIVAGLNTADGTTSNNIQDAEYAYGLAIDTHNNVWVGHAANVSHVFTKNTVTASTTYSYANTAYSNTVPGSSNYAYGLAIDKNQNIWAVNDTASGTGGGFFYLPNSGTVSSPAYSNTGAYVFVKSAFTTTSTYGGYGISFDSSSHAYISAHSGLVVVTPSYGTNGNISSVSTAATVSVGGAAQGYNATDGAGALYSGYNSSSTSQTITVTNGTSGTLAYSFIPCAVITATSKCAISSTGAGEAPQSFAVDSAGSLWVAFTKVGTNPTTTPYVMEIIGIATPAYPELSFANYGVTP